MQVLFIARQLGPKSVTKIIYFNTYIMKANMFIINVDIYWKNAIREFSDLESLKTLLTPIREIGVKLMHVYKVSMRGKDRR